MKTPILPVVLLACSGLCLQSTSLGHGGTYNGPGDTVPPGAGGGGGGAAGPTGGGTGGNGPSGPSGPTTGPGAKGTTPTGGPGGLAGSVATGGSAGGVDLAIWEFWWIFNKAPYLNLKAAVHAGIATDGDVFFQERGAHRNARDSMKPSPETIRRRVVPALMKALEEEKSNDIVTGALVALARIGEFRAEDGKPEIAPRIRRFLSDPVQEIAETAALSLGILGDEGSIGLLRDLLVDGPAGRDLCGRGEVPYRTRAFAAYGLGLIGSRAAEDEVRRGIARILVEALDAPETSTRDVQVAAMVALGLVPLDVDPGEGPEALPGPADSRQGLIRWIARYLQDERRPWMARAHAPAAIAKLLAGAPVGLKEGAARILLGAIDEHSKEKDAVRQGCVLALGQIGDSDTDPVDVEIRRALERSAADRDPQSRHFALIATAQAGGRRGSIPGVTLGATRARDFLLDALTKGNRAARPWAGLSLGVLERARMDDEQEPSHVVRETVRSGLRECSRVGDLGAFAIGCGIARDSEAKATLLEKFSSESDPTARGHLAVALGLLDAREAIGPIQAVLRESKYRSELLREAAIGLGLLGDKNLVPELVKMLQEAQGLSAQAAVASALGFIGDARSIDPLVSMLERKELPAAARGFAAVALGIASDGDALPWSARISVNINYRANTTTLTGQNGTGILDIL